MRPFQMAQYGDPTYRPPGITEADLLGTLVHGEVARPCLCGGVVIAYDRDPSQGVTRHQQTEQHREWSEKVYG